MAINELSKDSFKTTRRFYDDKNYPRGMGRSGDFTYSETEIVEQYGVAFQELSAGTREPVTAEEEQFVKVSKGELEPSTDYEKAWVKYQNKTLTPKQFHTVFGSNKAQVNEDDESPADDLDLE
ncbi:DUF413 domain-containing protein [Thalassomonas sp. M1454]|uniref:DUF413 domain-containing protein n=1 Tax=Thalassomonas sp. M1454 TaxID=2594477 RepID=UPI00117E4511|nr:DUF413 domain-containing protein [Thalassomonas sp. M1454]TRX54980.1 DUF413 domain-containing protein [Thalassomonas sp. M1454]